MTEEKLFMYVIARYKDNKIQKYELMKSHSDEEENKEAQIQFHKTREKKK